MKFLLKIISSIIIIFSALLWWNIIYSAGESSSESLKNTQISNKSDQTSTSNSVQLCGSDNCTVKQWALKINHKVTDIERERTFFDYVQSVLWFVVSFIYIIGTIYIIYAWFLLLMWTGDIIASWKAKSNIIYVMVWLVVIYMAHPIMKWLINLLWWKMG
jgi:hypothetical protein